MQYRILGKTGISVSVVGIESHQWSGRGGIFFSEAEVKIMLARARELGINFIDTGECYLYHTAERLIGDALRQNRKRFIIATKFGHTIREGEVAPGWDGRTIEKELHNSLKALRTDYIDIYQVHINAPGDGKNFIRHLSQIRRTLDGALQAGKIRFVGICLGDNVLFDKNGEILSQALKALPLSAVQIVYNRLSREAEKHIIPIAAKENLGIIARLPLAKAYLSSRFRPPKDAYDKKRLALVEKIKENEVPAGVDLAEWAIAWCLRREEIATAVPGCSAPEHLNSTAHALQYIK